MIAVITVSPTDWLALLMFIISTCVISSLSIFAGFLVPLRKETKYDEHLTFDKIFDLKSLDFCRTGTYSFKPVLLLLTKTQNDKKNY